MGRTLKLLLPWGHPQSCCLDGLEVRGREFKGQGPLRALTLSWDYTGPHAESQAEPQARLPTPTRVLFLLLSTAGQKSHQGAITTS